MISFSYIQITVMNILSERLSFCGYTPIDYLVKPSYYEHDGMAKEVILTISGLPTYIVSGILLNLEVKVVT